MMADGSSCAWVSAAPLGPTAFRWILYRAIYQVAPANDAALVSRDWVGISFVRSTKAILERCIREKGIALSPEGEAALAALPPTFDAWKGGANGTNPKAATPKHCAKATPIATPVVAGDGPTDLNRPSAPQQAMTPVFKAPPASKPIPARTPADRATLLALIG